MRTKALLLTAALSAAGVATSMAQVYSVNAVGYVNTVLHPGFTLISNPLTATDNTLAGLFGGGKVPIGTVVYKYNPGTGFAINTYTDDEVFAPDPTVTIVPGEGVFIKNPTAADVTVTFVGEVVQNTSSAHVVVNIPQGLSIRSSKVPQAGTATDLGLVGGEGDTLYQYVNKFPASGSGYTISTIQDGEWGPALGSLKVGEAFFYKAVTPIVWDRNFSVNSQ